MSTKILKTAMFAIAMLHCAIALAVPTIFNVSPSANGSNTLGDIVFVQGDGFGTSPKVQFSTNSNIWTSVTPLTVVNNTVTLRLASTTGSQGLGAGPAGSNGGNGSPSTSATSNGFYQSQVADLAAGQGLPANSQNLYTVRVSADGVNWSAPAFINRAHAIHYDTPVIASHSNFRIFGRNLYLGSGTPTVRLVDQATGVSLPATVSPISGNSYVLPVTAPSGIVPGHTYTVYVSNGYNGSSAFGTGETTADETLTGWQSGNDVWSLGVPWGGDFAAAYNNVYNVQTDPRLALHAVGDGVNNDQPAIQQAINTASASGGGVVYLPAGVYKLSTDGSTVTGEIELENNVVVTGASQSSTTVEYGYGTVPTSAMGYAVTASNCWNPVGVTGIANVSLVCENTAWRLHIRLSSAYTASEIFIKNVSLTANNGNMIMLGNANCVAIENSTFKALGGPTFGDVLLGTVNNYIFRGNTAVWSSGAVVNINSSTDGVFEQNTFTRNCNYALYPQEPNTRCFDFPYIKNCAILNNTFNVTGGPANDVYNDGESISQERPGGTTGDACTGTVTSATSTTLVDNTKSWTSSTFRTGTVVAIVSGTGTGQWRTIQSASGKLITLSSPWTITPAAGSTYAAFSWNGQNMLIQGNVLTNNRVGIQMYQCAEDNLAIVGNTLTNSNGIVFQAYQNNANPSAADLFDPIWNTQVVGNTIVDSNNTEPAEIGLVFAQVQSPLTLGAAGLGFEIRNNTIQGYSTVAWPQSSNLPDTEGYWDFAGYENVVPTNSVPAILGSVVQGNSAAKCGVAYLVSSGNYGAVLADATSTNISKFLSDGQILLPTSRSTDLAVEYQAENATLAGGAKVATDVYASGAEYVTGFQNLGAVASFVNVDGQSGKSQTLLIRYASATAATLTLVVNGVSAGNVSFASTGASSGQGAWSTTSVTVSLVAGTNNRIQFETLKGNAGVNIDKITVQ